MLTMTLRFGHDVSVSEADSVSIAIEWEVQASEVETQISTQLLQNLLVDNFIPQHPLRTRWLV